MLLVLQNSIASRMSALEWLLIGFAAEMDFQMFVENVSAGYVAQAPFVCELCVADANEACWLVEDDRKGVVAVLLARIDAAAQVLRDSLAASAI